MTNNNHQLLRFELLKRLRAAYPTVAHERLELMAVAIENTRAYQHDGERIIPVGDEAAMRRASNVAALVVGTIANEHVRHAASASSPEAAPYNRFAARMQSMGVNPDTALDGPDDTTFYGLDLNDLPPKDAA